MHLRALVMGDTGPGRLALRKRGAALPSLGKGFLYLPPQLKECPALIRCRRLPGLELALKENATFFEGRSPAVRG